MATKDGNWKSAKVFGSVKELDKPKEAKILGQMPSWLNGVLVRTGPAKFDFEHSSYNHWFDGQALLHRFQIKNEKVTYFNKFVQCESYTESLKHGRPCRDEFGTLAQPDPCKSIFSRYFSYFWSDGGKPTDNPLVNILQIKGKTYAASEIPVITEIDPITLEVLDQVSYNNDFKAGEGMTAAIAHPHEAPDGTVYNIRILYGRQCKWVVTEIPPKSDKLDEKPFDGGKAICSISPYSNLAYLHSFAMTENYFIVVENPLMLSLLKIILQPIIGYTFADSLFWDPDQLSVFHVIDRGSGNCVGKFTSQPFFCFHHINAYEDEESESIVIDLCGYKDASIIKSELYLHNLRANGGLSRSDMRRYKLPLNDLGEPNKTKLLSKGPDGLDHEIVFSGLELPQFNYGCYNGKPYRYVYGARCSSGDPIFFDQLVKLDLATKESKIWQEPNKYPSEPVFVPAPEPDGEDDGVVLSAVIDVMNDTTSLLILDAKDFTEVAIAVVPVATSYPLHGRFVSSKQV